jgi:hypothetical protein
MLPSARRGTGRATGRAAITREYDLNRPPDSDTAVQKVTA